MAFGHPSDCGLKKRLKNYSRNAQKKAGEAPALKKGFYRLRYFHDSPPTVSLMPA